MEDDVVVGGCENESYEMDMDEEPTAESNKDDTSASANFTTVAESMHVLEPIVPAPIVPKPNVMEQVKPAYSIDTTKRYSTHVAVMDAAVRPL
jgi:hypothetical protein